MSSGTSTAGSIKTLATRVEASVEASIRPMAGNWGMSVMPSSELRRSIPVMSSGVETGTISTSAGSSVGS
ncbi:MAG: hypothetical protein R2710_10900 [Acidimicrobiales bacterium]